MSGNVVDLDRARARKGAPVFRLIRVALEVGATPDGAPALLFAPDVAERLGVDGIGPRDPATVAADLAHFAAAQKE